MLMRHCFFEIRVLKTATCPNKSVSIFLQSMCLPFPSQLQGLSHSSWLGLLAGNSVQTFWSKQFLTWCYSNEYIYIYTYLLYIKQWKKSVLCTLSVFKSKLKLKKSKVKLFFLRNIYLGQTMWLDLLHDLLSGYVIGIIYSYDAQGCPWKGRRNRGKWGVAGKWEVVKPR